MYQRKTTENAALLTEAFQKWQSVDPERLYIRDVMTFQGNDDEGWDYTQLQFQATVKGMTDWYSFQVDENNQPIPSSIQQLPF